ncbi:DUF4143 domain-containing protein [candidate division KSB1 bacterium]|nr:DUF4143 domain-containing protein [candidate division KSB1 bacterium]
MYIPRDAENSLQSLAKGFPVVAVTGPRQSGKSTLVRKVFPQKPYVTLEDLDVRRFAQDDPRGFFASYPDGAILDEVQRVPQLFSYLQKIVDHSKKMGQFILTGSQQFGLSQAISQSLAGRVAFIQLLPFSFPELSRVKLLDSFFHHSLFKGFYPPVYDRDLSPSIWYANYVRTYLERDVRQMIQVRDLSGFQRFIKLCAAHTGQLVNFSTLANDCGITHNTARAWISILEASYIVYLLIPHHENFNKRLIKTPKLYFLDSGLAAHLLGAETADQIMYHPLRGALFESMIVAELLKSCYNNAQKAPLYFWRDRTGNEIDILIEHALKLDPVEIKSGQTINPDYFKMLIKWSGLAGKRAGNAVLIYGGDQHQKRTTARILPWYDAHKAMEHPTF